MSFPSFSIRRISNNTIVPLEEVDPIVRKELSLKDNKRDTPYGHFYFTELGHCFYLKNTSKNSNKVLPYLQIYMELIMLNSINCKYESKGISIP